MSIPINLTGLPNHVTGYIKRWSKLVDNEKYAEAYECLYKAYELTKSNQRVMPAILSQLLLTAQKAFPLVNQEFVLKRSTIFFCDIKYAAGIIEYYTKTEKTLDAMLEKLKLFYEEIKPALLRKSDRVFNSQYERSVSLIIGFLELASLGRFSLCFNIIFEWLSLYKDKKVVINAINMYLFLTNQMYLRESQNFDFRGGELQRAVYEFATKILQSYPDLKVWQLSHAFESAFEFEDQMKCLVESKPDNSIEFDEKGQLENILNKEAYLGEVDIEAVKKYNLLLYNSYKAYDIPNRTPNYFRRLKVGFLTADLREHAVSKILILLLLNIPSNTDIDLIFYYVDIYNITDKYTEMFEKHAMVKKFHTKVPVEIANTIKDDNLDIFIDLQGNTVGHDERYSALRYAPIQISYLGGLRSSCNPNIDYLLTDEYAFPKGSRRCETITEKPLYMYPSIFAFTIPSLIDTNPEPPSVRNGYVTFGNMSNPLKFCRQTMELWKRVLDAVPNARLRIQLSSKLSDFRLECLQKRFTKFGIDWDRIDMGEDFGAGDYFNQYVEKMDIMLDTVSFSGQTTTRESLYMGVPVLVLNVDRGQAGGYPVLKWVGGLDDFMAETMDEYVVKAASAAQNIERLRYLRRNLRNDMARDDRIYAPSWYRRGFDNAMRDAFLEYCRDNKKPFDASVYEGDFDELTQDTLLAIDIICREADKEPPICDLSDLISEFIEMMKLVLEKLLDAYEEEPNALMYLQKIIDLLNLLTQTTDIETVKQILNGIQKMLVKLV